MDRPSWIGRRGGDLRALSDLLHTAAMTASRHRIASVSAGVAFYGLLALVPTLGVIISLVRWIGVDGGVVPYLDGLLPASSMSFLTRRLESVPAPDAMTLSLGVIVSVVAAVWSASSAAASLVEGLTITADREERRGILEFRWLALRVAMLGIAFGVVVVGMLAAVPLALSRLPADDARVFVAYLRWPLLAAIVTASLVSLYRYAVPAPVPRWRRVLPGAVAGAAVWLVTSSLVTAVVTRFADYESTYGGVAGVIALMIWLQAGAFCGLLGAELNAALELNGWFDPAPSRGPRTEELP